MDVHQLSHHTFELMVTTARLTDQLSDHNVTTMKGEGERGKERERDGHRKTMPLDNGLLHCERRSTARLVSGGGVSECVSGHF